jgi:integrase/recombinase XerD
MCRPSWNGSPIFLISKPSMPISYKIDVSEFSAFTGLQSPAELRTVTRAHVIAWRKDLEARGLKGASTSGAAD